MAYIPQSNETGSGTREELNSFEDAFIARGLIVSSSDAYGIFSTGNGNSVNVQGTVSAALVAVKLGEETRLNYGHDIIVGRDGYVATTSGSAAIEVTGHSSTVDIQGEVWGGGYGIELKSDRDGADTVTRLNNSGTIRGEDVALRREGDEDFHFINSGRLIADPQSMALDGYASGDDTVVNTGFIQGDVMLGTGHDIYDGRNGKIIGEIFGDIGRDTILAGSGNDRLGGGEGSDTLSGGKGRDVFVFDTAFDDRTKADAIRDFRPQDDTMEIVGFLAEGALPEGRLGAAAFTANTSGKATDAEHHAIYETDAGRLYFDVDGKGGEKAVLFATVGKGLDIDHRDFLVVVPDTLDFV